MRFGARLAPERRAELLERFADERFLTDLREEALPALDQALAIHRDAGDLLRAGDVLRLRARLKSDIGRTAEARIDVREAVEILTAPARNRAGTHVRGGVLPHAAGL